MNGPMTTEETCHISNILKHYAHAIKKHPYFCDLLSTNINPLDSAAFLREARRNVEDGIKKSNLAWHVLLSCEAQEGIYEIVNGNNAQAVEELYDCIAVCLRAIDVIEGRQPLGKPEAKGGNQ